MAETERWDAIVIGTGQGGKPLAGALAEAGWRTAIIEKSRVGGTCVLTGCTPTKTMIASARVAHLVRRAHDYGIETGDLRIDLRRVRERKRAIVENFSSGSRKGLERHDDLELVFGTARFVGVREVEVALQEGGSRRLTSDHIFINVGARPRVPDLPGLDRVSPLHAAGLMELETVPDHLVVLGGGFIGLEFGQMFRRFGADVSIVERRRLVSREDPDVSEALTEILQEEGIQVHTGAQALRVDNGNGSSRSTGEGVHLYIDVDGDERRIEGSHLLLAIGTEPNSDLLNVEATGIELDDRGQVPVNGRCETSAEGIWALGDVTGGPPFTHTSYDDFRIIRDNVLHDGDATKDGRVVPYTLFTDPQLGRVGLSEEEAKRESRAYTVAKLPMSRVARAIETDETRGFMKALVDPETEEILGATILGIDAGEVITVVQTAMMGGLPWTALRDAVFSHPTVSESLNNLFMTLDP
ncbi:MAG: mercuric reductase [Gemmatimonadetes bacterium]|nr:mercuric reductase [Gemmatimonadota bacterium]